LRLELVPHCVLLFLSEGGFLLPTLAAKSAAKVGHPSFCRTNYSARSNSKNKSKVNCPTQRKER
jgi:hypothetical protein